MCSYIHAFMRSSVHVSMRSYIHSGDPEALISGVPCYPLTYSARLVHDALDRMVVRAVIRFRRRKLFP